VSQSPQAAGASAPAWTAATPVTNSGAKRPRLTPLSVRWAVPIQAFEGEPIPMSVGRAAAAAAAAFPADADDIEQQQQQQLLLKQQEEQRRHDAEMAEPRGEAEAGPVCLPRYVRVHTRHIRLPELFAHGAPVYPYTLAAYTFLTVCS
jgi:hypothetical protein